MNTLKNTRLNLLPTIFTGSRRYFHKYAKANTMYMRLSNKSNKNTLYYNATRSFWKNKEENNQTEQKEQKKDETKEQQKQQNTESQEQKQEKKTNTEQKQETKTEEPKTDAKANTKADTKAETKKQEKKPETPQEKLERLLKEKTPEADHELKQLFKKQADEINLKSKAIEELTASLKNQEKANEDLRKKAMEIRNALQSQIEETELQRKRLQKEIEQTKVFAITKFAKDLIETPDNLSRALESAAKQYEGKDDPLYEGVKATNNILLKTLEKHGIKPINPIKEKFNPNYHEALFDYEDPSLEPGTIGQVASTGYVIADRVLRPAKVGIIRASEKKE